MRPETTAKIERIRALVAQGKCGRIVAQEIGLSESRTRGLALEAGISFPGKQGLAPRGPMPIAFEMAAMRAKGATFQQIGSRFGVSRQAVHQAVSRAHAHEGRA